MISGSADPEALASTRPTVASFDAPAVSLPGATVLQAMFEMPESAREVIVPPGLHPTVPAALVLVAWQCPESPWGAFSLVQTRAQVRSGTRPRGFVTGAWCNAADAAHALSEGFGFPARVGEIAWLRGYDRVELTVRHEGRDLLGFIGTNPDPLSPGDVQYSATLNLARTERGLRLLQVEPEYAVGRAERLRPALGTFDPAAFGDGRLDPYFPVSASVATADITIPALRFVCRPDVMAFEGTEPV